MKQLDLGGVWMVQDGGEAPRRAVLPGTLDENRIGSPDKGDNQWHPDAALGHAADLLGEGRILTRLTRNCTYEGPAVYTKTVALTPGDGARVFLEVERSRELSLACNGREAPCAAPGTLSTPAVFEITDCIKAGENTLALCCDNGYPTWPHDAIVFSSAATDETQTNWNGLLGYVRLRWEKPNYIFSVRVYPGLKTADVALELDCRTGLTDTLTLSCAAFAAPVAREIAAGPGRHTLWVRGIALAEGAHLWDEGEGNLYTLTASSSTLAPVQARFGVRTFGCQQGRLALNGRPIFLRSEANCCVFPETGHMPLAVEEWRAILRRYQSYGVNCMRFHSHCPPEAAFCAADELGMLMQPELSHWNPRTAFEDEKSWRYYRLELREILRAYANHPSFVMLTFGNELHTGALGHKRMDLLLQDAKALDPTRLYANGSNVHYGQIGPDLASDFYTSSDYYGQMLRGTSAQMKGFLNGHYPGARANYDDALAALREEFAGPVFSFEVGQFEVLPDFDELERFHGVTRADNLAYIRERAARVGLLPEWKKRVEASGELALIGYRAEIEAAMRTGGLSGISLLGLQDFPGQGTALVGMLDAHLQPKPYPFAQPERFRAFFAAVLPLALLERYTYHNGETLAAEIRLANYGKQEVAGPCAVRLSEGGRVVAETVIADCRCPCGGLSVLGEAAISLGALTRPARCTLSVQLGPYRNEYPVWVYPDAPLPRPETVVVAASLSQALAALEAGRDVLLDPPADEAHFPHSIQAQFTTDFWSVGTFPKQSGFMGLMLDAAHPAFQGFPTEAHSNWQWWPMCRGRAVCLPDGLEPIVAGLDCYARMRRLGLLLEAKAGNGRLLLSSMGLQDNCRYPEGKALLHSLLCYMAGPAFSPLQELPLESLQTLVRD